MTAALATIAWEYSSDDPTVNLGIEDPYIRSDIFIPALQDGHRYVVYLVAEASVTTLGPDGCWAESGEDFKYSDWLGIDIDWR